MIPRPPTRDGLRDLMRAPKLPGLPAAYRAPVLKGDARIEVPECSGCGISAGEVRIVMDSTIPSVAVAWKVDHEGSCEFRAGCGYLHFEGEKQVRCPERHESRSSSPGESG